MIVRSTNIVLILLALVIGLVGCATVPIEQGGTGLSALQTFTKADLAQASAIATAGGDTIAAACYDALNKHIGAIQERPAIKGVFSLYETARLGIAKIRGGVPQDVHVACAPIVLDAQHTLIRLGLIGSGLPIPGL
mgnify:CR=1 FL=1